jgi:hypothetical protein
MQWSEPDWKRFTTAGEFWSFVISHAKPGTKLYVFAHNTTFDFVVSKGFRTLPKRGWKLRSSIIDGPPFSLKYTNGSATIHVLDTLNYFRSSLAELGKSIGLAKLDMPDSNAPESIQDTYCKRDVEIICRAMLNYISIVKDWRLGNFAITQAAQSFAAFRHRFMQAPIYIDDHDHTLNLSRKAYYGGRVECYRLGEIREPLYLLDINSQYPYVMQAHKYPCRIENSCRNVTLSELSRWLKTYAITARCIVKTNEPVYPVNDGERLIFPVGEFETHLSTPELTYALAHSHIVKVSDAAIYNQAHLFQPYVEYFYRKRLEYRAQGNETLSYFCKIFMNSLYGKFGQNGRKFQRIGPAPDDTVRVWAEYCERTGETIHMRQYAGLIEEKMRDGEAKESFPAIAAHVTAYARMLLWAYIQRAGRENVYYVDTDSLLINAAGYATLKTAVDGQRLGALKLELGAESAVLHGAKDYEFGNLLKRKGIRPKATLVAPDTWEQDQFATMKGLLRRGNIDDFIIRRTRKHLTREYQKGRVMAGGKIVPLTITPSQGAP